MSLALSFISNLKKKNSDSSPDSLTPDQDLPETSRRISVITKQQGTVASPPPLPQQHAPSKVSSYPSSNLSKRNRSSSGRPLSALFPTHQVSVADAERQPTTELELEPVFGHFNTQSNKLYYEGYLLRLNDLDSCKFGSDSAHTLVKVKRLTMF